MTKAVVGELCQISAFTQFKIKTREEMFFYRPLPVLLKATLIPFRDKIISDGLVIPYNVCFGKGYSSEFKNIYMNAKKNKKIHFSL